jgi:cellulose synthase/poly-beta-1,6-N-acetylglucosamine synthase-like glycosyltransferase
MKVSLIVAVYKDIEALSLIVESLKQQTYKNFELVVAEDNDSPEMRAYIDSIRGITVTHVFQEDISVRKSRSQNNGIVKSTGEYLIFIDGDCIPYSTFIERHVQLAEEGCVISGRRVNLGPKYAALLRKGLLSPLELEKTFLFRYPLIASDALEKHTEAGFSIDPHGLLYTLFFRHRKSNTSILGCNFSCFKKDMMAINGFDEGYGSSPLSDDTDLQWRLEGLGLKIKSCKNIANVFHLYHTRKASQSDPETIEALWTRFHQNKAEKRFVCEIGLNTH